MNKQFLKNILQGFLSCFRYNYLGKYHSKNYSEWFYINKSIGRIYDAFEEIRKNDKEVITDERS